MSVKLKVVTHLYRAGATLGGKAKPGCDRDHNGTACWAFLVIGITLPSGSSALVPKRGREGDKIGDTGGFSPGGGVETTIPPLALREL